MWQDYARGILKMYRRARQADGKRAVEMVRPRIGPCDWSTVDLPLGVD
jgi:hypothetical protein